MGDAVNMVTCLLWSLASATLALSQWDQLSMMSSGQVARCCTSYPQAAAPCVEQPVAVPYVEQSVANVASWFVAGPLSMFGDLCGWGSGPITAPGSGTQSWLFCPLISMALARAEVLRSVVPFFRW